MNQFPDTGLDPRFAVALGRELRKLRQRRRETEDDVGRRLLLSENQVRGLEAGDPTAFYGPRYYIQAARKYAASAGLDFDALQAEIAANPELPLSPEADVGSEGAGVDATNPPTLRGEPRMSQATRGTSASARKRPAPGASAARVVAGALGRRPIRIAAAAVAVVGLALVGWMASTGQRSAKGTVTTQVPVPPAGPADAAGASGGALPSSSAAAATAAAPITAAPATPSTAAGTVPVSPSAPSAAAAASPKAAEEAAPKSPAPSTAKKQRVPQSGEIRIVFTGPTWVEYVRKDGKKSRKQYEAKQSLTLRRSTLQSLAIGNASKVRVTSEGRRIDLAPYRKAGTAEARLSGNRLRALGE